MKILGFEALNIQLNNSARRKEGTFVAKKIIKIKNDYK